jgi:deoxycytidylate deaminase
MHASCVKSRRGAIVFDHDLEERRLRKPSIIETFSAVANLIVVGQGYNRPALGACDGTDRCKADCSKRCVHAEQMAIREALGAVGDLHGRGLDVLHVKLDTNTVAPGGPPSCWQCSKEILDAGLRGVWLFEGTQEVNAMTVPYTVNYAPPGVWRYYTAKEFHVATLKNCGVHV